MVNLQLVVAGSDEAREGSGARLKTVKRAGFRLDFGWEFQGNFGDFRFRGKRVGIQIGTPRLTD